LASANKNPEQIARDMIDARLEASGWAVQDKKSVDFAAASGIAVTEYTTSVGPADYVLFADKKALGVVESKNDTWGAKITTVEEQSSGYAEAELKWVSNSEPLPFTYEATGVLTRFTDRRDPNPRSREVFSFHRPETLREWAAQPKSFRARLQDLPALDPQGLRECQIKAIDNLEASLKADKPRALIQMATGSGKTFTAITEVYRLLKFAGAMRILFLVDTRNLGEQAEGEFIKFVPTDDNRKFTELYTVQRLNSSFVSKDAQVCISTIQRLYSILKGEEMPEGADEENPAERERDRQGAAARCLQCEAAARILRRRHHRRVPPLDLQSLASSSVSRPRPTTAPTVSSGRTWSANTRTKWRLPTGSMSATKSISSTPR
jgi:type I restriction enzyme R subunit